MVERLEHNTHSHLQDFLGFVILCCPDHFPTDEGAEYGPQNMSEAFEDLQKGFRAIRPKSRNKQKIDRLSEMVAEAEVLHSADDNFGCIRLLQRVRYAMSRSGKSAEKFMASGPRAADEVDRLAHDSIAIAKESLRRSGDFAPFARILLEDGTTEQLQLGSDADGLYETVHARIAELRSVAVTTKGRHKAPDHTKHFEPSLIDYDAIMIDCDHRDHEAYTFVLPYRFSSSGFEHVQTHKAPQIKARRRFFSD